MWAIFNICVTTWSSTESQQMFYFADSLKVSSVSFKLFTSARVRMSFSNVIWNHAAGPNKVTGQLQWSFSNLVLEGSLDKSVLPSESHQMKASLQTGCCANIGFRCALMPSYLWKAAFFRFRPHQVFPGPWVRQEHFWVQGYLGGFFFFSDCGAAVPHSSVLPFTFSAQYFSFSDLPLSNFLSHIVSPFTPTLYLCLYLWHLYKQNWILLVRLKINK